MTVGTKVVCIDDKFSLDVQKLYVGLPKAGEVYVIRAMMPGIGPNMEPEIAVLLVGLHNPKSNKPPYPERGFKIERFRPLEEIQQENRERKGQPAKVEEEEEVAVP